MLKIERENALKEEIASACDIRNKQGEIQPSKVKMPLVVALIDEIFLNKNNKKDIEYALMETYRGALADKSVNEEVIKNYVALKENLEENNQNLKEAFKETNVLDKEILDAIDYIAKAKYKELLESKKLELGAETKPQKDMSAMMDIIKELEKLYTKA